MQPGRSAVPRQVENDDAESCIEEPASMAREDVAGVLSSQPAPVRSRHSSDGARRSSRLREDTARTAHGGQADCATYIDAVDEHEVGLRGVSAEQA